MVDEVGRHIAAGERMKNNNPLAIWGHSADAISWIWMYQQSLLVHSRGVHVAALVIIYLIAIPATTVHQEHVRCQAYVKRQ